MFDIVFTKENIDEYLRKLAKCFRKLNGNKTPAEIILVGGAAVMLNYDFRDQSNDIDAVIYASSAMTEAINQIRDEENLQNGWLNSDFMKTASYSPNLRLYSRHYKTFSNIVEFRTVSVEYLIAMKLMAGRKYKNDLSDILGILEGEHQKGNDISLEKIKLAAKALYGDYDNLPESSRGFIEGIFLRLSCDIHNIYEEFRVKERENKKILVEFEKQHPNVLTYDNMDEILSAAKKKI